ncbi:MAG: FAD-dependent oxidoreductase [Gammaproteobacteria bacterium]|nr:FAD-dependent oxidoreductase [Gammaproteobacteria bacterium]NIR82937.1 FAD-dependent oxidoreductase [Gammaproteobacteria bacterium]NIR90206.1 FAD-dependent oxidoreductase [Gammaproteobacteria bacterium]NIU04083.1 FAD-dependent oxidoreductase [Gammaproteobacteria bacterium]NIV51072.1 FAD-dependent oxidoreductase [Gammaproteobacteria bacterium]
MNPTRQRSLWLQEALTAEDVSDAPSLEGDARADVAIIGGGFTGLWTALRLKEHEPGLDVAVVERDICGGGASGRNGGFVLSWWAKYLTLEKLCGPEEALRLARASQQAVDEVGRFCAAHAPGADFRRDGWLWVATSNAQIGAWQATVEALRRRQVNPFVELESVQVARRAGSPRHLAGVLDPQAATVQPAHYARGLRRRALELGVRIFEHSPMRRLKRSRPPVVETACGRLSADKVVIASNAWSVQEPELRRALVVTSSDVVATRAVPDWLESIGRIDGLAISDSRLTVHYYRTTSDGRMVFGKGGGSGALAFGGRLGPGFDGTSPYADEVERWMRWTYPDMPREPRAADWTGPIDKTKSGLPLFGGLASRADILYGVGFSGNGVGPTVLAGRILASLVLGLDDEWARCGLVRAPHRDFPPEPVRYVGGKLVRLAIKKLDEDQDAGREPNILVRRLASLAPVALSPVKSRGE